jgi:hypothetical protein
VVLLVIATHIGSLPVSGRTVCVPKADANLLSLKLLIRNGGRFEGNYSTMRVYDAQDNIIVTGIDNGDGYWSCSYKELFPTNTTAYSSQIIPLQNVPEQKMHLNYVPNLVTLMMHMS